LPLTDIFHRQRDEAYERDLQAEAEFWNKQDSCLLAMDAEPSVQRYQNERLSGQPEREWYETISDHGDARQGCILGAGPGKLEAHLLQRNPNLQLTVYDIAEDTLRRLVEKLPTELKPRVETRQEDLNFVELHADGYDLVVAQACIHHIVNLEHLAYQVNRSLTPAGRFFMYDVVSESYLQFEEKKKRLFELLMTATGDQRTVPERINWPDRSNWTGSPFESVRSGDILEVFGSYLEEESVRTANSLVGLTIMRGGAQRRGNRLSRAVRRVLDTALDVVAGRGKIARGIASGELLFEIDSLCCDTGYLKPGVAFGVYRKRS